MTDFDTNIQAAAQSLLGLGFSVHWLHRKQKRPVGNDWQNATVPTATQLARSYESGMNLGVRLGEPSRVGSELYLHVIDVDIRVPELAAEANAKLRELLPVNPDALPMVRSGSGGASFHLYFVTTKAFRSKRLAVSDGKHRDKDGKWHFDYEVELFGTGKQVVLPPSIHPSGRPYVWEREFDAFEMEFEDAYTIDADDLTSLAVIEQDSFQYESVPPLDFKSGRMEALLDDVPVSDLHYDDWIRLGQALHHQLGGTEEGFQLWLKHTERSEKHDGKNSTVRTMRMKWRSFGKYRGRPVTMATISQWAQEARADAMAAEFEELEDLDDEEAETAGRSDRCADGDDFAGMFDDVPDNVGADDVGGVGSESEPTPAKPEDAIDDGELPDIHWSKLLDKTEEGAIKGTLHNITLIVQNDPRTKGIIRKNVFAEKLVQFGKPGKRKKKAVTLPTLQLVGEMWNMRDPINGDPWNDSRDALLRRMIEAPTLQGGYGLKVSDRDLASAIDITGSDNAFHPVRDYLKSLTWDGVARMDRLFIDYAKTPDNAYYRSIARLTLVAGVTRVFEPGHKFDFAPILEGLQGRRKSTFIKVLGKHWSAELDGDFADDRSMIEKMLGNWVLEIPELSAFGKAEVNHIKAFMSRQEDRARLAYDRRVTIFQRQCIFMGSTNDKKYLKDETGGRRFWPVECTLGPDEEIDTDTLELNVDQLWAEAYHEYCQMRAKQPRGNLPLYLRDTTAARIAAVLQESRRIENSTDSIKGIIVEYLDRPQQSGNIDDAGVTFRDKTCAMEIWVQCFGGEKKNFPYQNQMAINKVLRSLDRWEESGQKRFGDLGVQKAYVRVKEETTNA